MQSPRGNSANSANLPNPAPAQKPSTPPTPPTPRIADETSASPDAPTVVTPPLNTQPGPFGSAPARLGQAGQQATQQGKTLWSNFRGMPRIAQVLIAVGAVLTLMVCSCCSCTGLVGALGGGTSTAQSTATTSSHTSNSGIVLFGTATATSGSTATATPDATATPAATSTATTQPTATPHPQPTATPKPKPQPTATPKPKPTCIPGAVNCNPWGYNFSSGSYIYSPPGSFCSYFRCINNFWNGIGYVMECQDGMYSKSGGHSGSCSYHGGNLRPLLTQ